MDTNTHETKESALYGLILDIEEPEYVPPEITLLCKTYQDSKIFRLGAAYLDTSPAFRNELAQETGLREKTLQYYACLASLYMPKSDTVRLSWTDEEDNLIMDTYQRTTIRKLMKLLPGRSFATIKNRASYLGVSKPKTKIR